MGASSRLSNEGCHPPNEWRTLGLGFGIKTANAANLLSLANGGILESNSMLRPHPGQNSKKIFHRPLLGLASQHLLLPLVGSDWKWSYI